MQACDDYDLTTSGELSNEEGSLKRSRKRKMFGEDFEIGVDGLSFHS